MSERTNTARWVESRKHWRIDVQRDGVRKPFYSSTPGRKGQRECNAKADKWLEKGIVDLKIKTKDAYENFLAYMLENKKSDDQIKKYKRQGKYHILPIIGNKRVADLDNEDLQEIIDKAYNHKDKNKPLAKKSYANIREAISAFMKYCRRKKISNLIPEIEIPKNAPEGKRTILQPDDIKTLFSKDYTLLYNKETLDIYVNAYRFEVATGLRPGEMKGLKWADIDGNKVSLKRSINYKNETTTGKNKNAVRSFYLNSTSMMILEMQKKLMEHLKIESEYVFPNKYGEAANQSSYSKRWNIYRDYHGLSGATTYELRHTFVSIVKTLPEGLLKSLIGHSKDMDTYGVYSHEVVGDAEYTASEVDKIFKKIL